MDSPQTAPVIASEDTVTPVPTINVPVFNVPTPTLGRVFPSKSALLASVTLACCSTGRRFSRQKRENQISFHCTSDSCEWRVCATGSCEERTVTVSQLRHMDACNPGEGRVYGLKTTIAYLSLAKYKELGTKYKKSHLVQDLKSCGITVGKDTVYRALGEADKEINGDPHEGFAWLQAWFTSLAEQNPGTQWDIKEEGGRFKSFFLALGASLEGVGACPGGFGVVDGCFLRAHYLGTLLTFVAMDPLGSQLPVGFALIGNEDAEGWKYFLGKLESAVKVPEFLGEGFGLMADQDKGLLSVLRGDYNDVIALKCTQHMGRNIKAKFSKEMFGRFKHLCTAPSYRFLPMFDALGESAGENELEVLHEYLDEKEPETWARGAIRSRTYNQSTNNLAEGFNNVISSARDKNVLGMLNSIVSIVQKWHYERRRSDLLSFGSLTKGV